MALTTNETAWYSYTSSTETMKTWPQVLSSFKDVPPQFQAAFPEHDRTFPYTVLIPADPFAYLLRRSEKLLCLYDDHVTILETVGGQVNTASYPFHEILYVRQGRVLLSGRLTIASRTSSTSVAFNAVNMHQFEPIIGKIRQGMIGSQSGNGHGRQFTGLEFLSTINYRLMNYGRQSIRPEEKLIKAVYQPDRHVKSLGWIDSTLFTQSNKGYLATFANYAKTLRMFTKPRVNLSAPGHLSILTDQELILIKAGKRIKIENENVYGGVLTYIPLEKIQDISCTPDVENARFILTIMLPDKLRFRTEFSIDNMDVQVLQQEYAKIKTNA